MFLQSVHTILGCIVGVQMSPLVNSLFCPCRKRLFCNGTGTIIVPFGEEGKFYCAMCVKKFSDFSCSFYV